MVDERPREEPRMESMQTSTVAPMQYRPGVPFYEKLFSKQAIAFFILIGIFLMGIGTVIQNASAPAKSYADVKSEDISKKIQDDTAANANTYKVGTIVWNFGMIFIMLSLVGGAILNPTLDTKTRIVMLIVAMFILVGPFASTFKGFDHWNTGYSPSQGL